MIFTFDQAHAYFANRLQEPNLPHRVSLSVRCPFHGDRTASMSVNLDKGGVWNCHGCQLHGGIYDFEKQMFGLTRTNDELWAEIYRVSGATPSEKSSSGRSLGPVLATYSYTDQDGRLLFEKRRHANKVFVQRAPDGKGGWQYNLTGVKKVLYNLPLVMQCAVIFVCEGEKDCDNLNALLQGKFEVTSGRSLKAVATCNFDGAGKWSDEYSVYFAGRRVVVFPDNDDIGRTHASEVARSAAKHAVSVKIVALPGLPPKGDLTDFLEGSTPDALKAAISTAPLFSEVHAVRVVDSFFVAADAVFPDGVQEPEWYLPGIIHRNSKGMIIAQPKAGKSMIGLDLSVALAAGQPWLGIYPSRAARVGFLSREDSPSMTIIRLREFARARGLHLDSMPNLQLNTFRQRRMFAIDDDEHLEDLCRGTKEHGLELIVIDVLNKIHSVDENDNTKMSALMKRFDYVKDQTGADIAIIHHDSKNALPGSRRPRGASSIDSWWEWKIALNVDPDDDSIKEAHFGSKAAQQHSPIRLQIRNDQNGCDLVVLPRY